MQDSGNYVEINSDGSPALSDLATYQTRSIEYAVNNGLTYLDVKAIGIAEIPVAYGHLFELSGGNLMVGGAVKYMHALPTAKTSASMTPTVPTTKKKIIPTVISVSTLG